jgi:regulation of enolase protein 1 (concanavalin A-like superfamily)
MKSRMVDMVGVCALVALASYGSHSTVIAQTALPAPWTTRNIGGASPAGTASYNQQLFSVSASGVDVWSTSDQFRFVYQQVTGDVDVVARIDSFAAADPWSKIGVMVRADLTASSAHGFMILSGANGTAFQRRPNAGGTSATTAGPLVNAPQWVKISRVGTTVTGYSAADGATWQKIGSATVALGASAYVGIGITSHNPGTLASAVVSNVAVTPRSLPNGQQTQDIGAPAIAGSASYSNGQYTITAAGTDIQGSSDQFRFVYQQISGDVDVIARVNSLQNVSAWSKAGIMIRETLSANSRNAMALMSAGKGYSYQWRTDTGGITTYVRPAGGTAPAWVRLIRTGTKFEALRSTDGASWSSMGSQTIAMAGTVYVGLAVTSHNASAATTAVFDQLSVTPLAAGGGNQPPAITLTSPVPGGTYGVGQDIPITATASDPEGRLSKVEFYIGTTLIATDTTAPFETSWAGSSSQAYTVTAIAYDADGGSTSTTPFDINLGTATTNLPPTVSLTSPTAGASFTPQQNIPIAATAADPEGRLSKVEFYVGSTLIATDTTSPFSTSWATANAGTYAIKAIAYDADGGSTGSATVNVTVSSGTTTNQPPSVTLTSPVNGATFATSASISIGATASDPENRLSKVEFYVGTTLIATDTTSPFSTTWSTTTAGSYTVKAIAYDADGGKTTSNSSVITVGTTSTVPKTVVFTASPDHATLVTSYRLDVFSAGANPSTATPVATVNLGKPTPASNGDITVNEQTFFSGLNPGTYQATVSAIGAVGESRSTPVTFVR